MDSPCVHIDIFYCPLFLSLTIGEAEPVGRVSPNKRATRTAGPDPLLVLVSCPSLRGWAHAVLAWRCPVAAAADGMSAGSGAVLTCSLSSPLSC